MSTEGIG